jgi:malate dehydrogenase
MTVRGAADVDAVGEGGTLTLGPRDIVTPLARERAQELGVSLVVGSSPAPSPSPAATWPSTRPTSSVPATSDTRREAIASVPQPGRSAGRPPASPAGGLLGRGAAAARAEGAPREIRPPSGALFRRGAPLPAAVRPDRGATGRVVVVGAGHVGMIAAMRLADADVFAEVVLVDIDEDRAAGIALDLTHTAALGGFATRVRGVGTVAEAGPADYVVITAGRARQPGMTRADLVDTNAAIVGDVAAKVAAVSPHAVIVVVTNPLDEMTQHAWRASGFPSERVVGMAGLLDTARFQALASLTGVARADRIDALALGSHGDEMVIPLSRATAGGEALSGAIDRKELDAIVNRARGSGAEVVGLLKTGSAFMAPGTSSARMVLAMARDTGELMSAAVLAHGEYGLRDVYVGLPVRLGPGGLREIVELELTHEELGALRVAADRIRERVGALAGAS